MPKVDELSNGELFDKLLQAIKSEGEKTKEDIKKNISEENKKLRELLGNQNEKIKILEDKCCKLEEKNIILERLSRKNNIVIFGFGKLSRSNLVTEVIQKLNSILEIDLKEQDVNNIFTLNSNDESPIKVEFLSYLKKRNIFENVHKLKGSKISVFNDMCFEDRNNFKILQYHMKEARSKKLLAKIKGHKLIINGESYTAQQLREKSPEPPETSRRGESKSDSSTPIFTRNLQIEKEKVDNITNSAETGQNGNKHKEEKNQKATTYNTRPRVNSNTLSNKKH